jgi:hypothetical protein
VVGQVRLIGETRDAAGYYMGDIVLADVSGVPVYLHSDGETLDSTASDSGRYVLSTPCAGTYDVRTWVVPSISESVGPIECTTGECVAPDTLTLDTHGAIVACPNPFTTSTEIRFEIEQSSMVQLVVLGVDLGTVKTIVDGSLEPGRYAYRWSALEENNVRVPLRPYWIVLRVGEEYNYCLAIVADIESPT